MGARSAAFGILTDVDAGEFAGRAAARRLGGLAERDRGLAMEIAFGSLRLRGRLDVELERLCSRPLHRLDRPVLNWLRLGLYQLRELRMPEHAAVNETVESAKRTSARRASGLINGVLRTAARRGRPPGLFPTLELDPVAYLATWGSHPRWLVERWLACWPLADVVRLVEYDNRPPRPVLRLLDGDVSGLVAARSGPRLEPRPPWARSYEIVGAEPAVLLARVPGVIQDPAASAVVEYVGSEIAGPVLDACAAPGGKAISLAQLAPVGRPFVTADVSFARLGRLVNGRARTGAELHVVVMDARRPALRRVRTVLLDAPCSGTGVLSRRADARWRIDAERLASLVRLQRELLDSCAALVEPGGLLVYATCSLEAEENEGQVDEFLRRHRSFAREGPQRRETVPEAAMDERGDLRVLPWQWGTDGAYACRLRRNRRGGMVELEGERERVKA